MVDCKSLMIMKGNIEEKTISFSAATLSIILRFPFSVMNKTLRNLVFHHT